MSNRGMSEVEWSADAGSFVRGECGVPEAGVLRLLRTGVYKLKRVAPPTVSYNSVLQRFLIDGLPCSRGQARALWGDGVSVWSQDATDEMRRVPSL